MNKKPALLILVLILFLSTTLYGCPSSSSSEQKPQNNANNVSSEKVVDKEVTLYFSDDQIMYLLPELRTIEIKESDNPTPLLAEAIVKELIAGPKNEKLSKTIPPESKLNSIKIEDNMVYVDMSEEFKSKHWGGSSGEIMTIGSLANSLTEIDGIEKVQLLINGQKTDTLAGHLDISQPITRDEALIKK